MNIVDVLVKIILNWFVTITTSYLFIFPEEKSKVAKITIVYLWIFLYCLKVVILFSKIKRICTDLELVGLSITRHTEMARVTESKKL